MCLWAASLSQVNPSCLLLPFSCHTLAPSFPSSPPAPGSAVVAPRRPGSLASGDGDVT